MGIGSAVFVAGATTAAALGAAWLFSLALSSTPQHKPSIGPGAFAMDKRFAAQPRRTSSLPRPMLALAAPGTDIGALIETEAAQAPAVSSAPAAAPVIVRVPMPRPAPRRPVVSSAAESALAPATLATPLPRAHPARTEVAEASPPPVETAPKIAEAAAPKLAELAPPKPAEQGPVAPAKAPEAAVPASPKVAEAPAKAAEPAPKVAEAMPPAPKPVPPIVKLPQTTHGKAMTLAGLDGRTAVYDISARSVYMPNGETLEAHSGLGEKMDDPRFIHIRMRGPTPPNVYTLTMREKLFHGVRAIRLNPVDGDKMFGRDGMLAHTYMLGPNGQSNGCVSFKDYNKFLNAFLDGQVDRMIVVARLDGKAPALIADRPRTGPGSGRNRFAAVERPDMAKAW